MAITQRLRSIRFGLVCLTITMLSGLPAAAGLTLEIGTTRAGFLLEEPVLVTVSLWNRGTEQATILRTLDTAVGQLRFDVLSSNGYRHRYRPCLEARVSATGLAETAISVSPGDRYSSSVDLTFEMREGRRTALLSQAGSYVLQAEYSIPEGFPGGPLIVRSNDLHIVVHEPVDKDLQAYDLLRQSPRYGSDGLWNVYEDQIPTYTSLLQKLPDTSYAAHARYYLAQAHELRYILAPRTPDGLDAARTAADLYVVVAQRAGDSPLYPEAMRYAGRCLARTGDVIGAQRRFEASLMWHGSTDEERLNAVSFLGLLEQGYWQEKLPAPANAPVKVLLPIRNAAEALGLSVEWDHQAKVVKVAHPGFRSILRPGSPVFAVNGVERSGAVVALNHGSVQVSPAVIACLMAERHGKGVAGALQDLLAAVPEVRTR